MGLFLIETCRSTRKTNQDVRQLITTLNKQKSTNDLQNGFSVAAEITDDIGTDNSGEACGEEHDRKILWYGN